MLMMLMMNLMNLMLRKFYRNRKKNRVINFSIFFSVLCVGGYRTLVGGGGGGGRILVGGDEGGGMRREGRRL